ncbi:MAG: response regulator transcription factor [Ahrensia sp.]
MTDNASPKPEADDTTLPDGAPHVLVVDDDTRIRTLLTQFLQKHHYRVTAAKSAADARAKMRGLAFDVTVLDIMMPGEDGISLARSLREARADVPIIMLTAKSETEERIQGLEAGADDYLTKPFDPRELVLRINSLIRRVSPSDPQRVEQLVFGPFTFALARRELKKNGVVVKLTEREKDIMLEFAQKPGETVPRDDLCPPDTEIGERTIDVQINRLRRKLESDPTNPVWLQTVRGIGYRLSIE